MMSTKNEAEEFSSKSQRKREMHELQALGERLVNYSEEKLAQFNLSGELSQAIAEAKRINSPIARSRQYQYIGRLMRKIDLEPLIKVMNRLDHVGPEAIAEQQVVEQWRHRLMTEGKPALSEFVEQYHLYQEVQHLRHLIGAAQKEVKHDQSKKARKELYQFIASSLSYSPL